MSEGDVDKALADFAKKLIAEQEPLGNEFREIYFKHAWKLYD